MSCGKGISQKQKPARVRVRGGREALSARLLAPEIIPADYVPYMSLICPLYVPHMSLICPLYIPYMSLICPLYVASNALLV